MPTAKSSTINSMNGATLPNGTTPTTGRCFVAFPNLVGRVEKGEASREIASRLEEAVGLATAIHLDVVDTLVVNVPRPRPATLFGPGQVEEIRERVVLHGAELVVVDSALSPIQQRNLERAWDAKVLDRTGLILEIFGARARTKEGQLQVELAALSYQRSRLVRSWTHLERQRGGFGFMGGPGESQIEIDRRLIDERMTKLRGQLETTKRTRGLHRDARRRVPYPVVALVGYTNAGKSTLFNRLTSATVDARDQVFATLDPTMRAITLPSGQMAILSDTVGFISDLPTQLVAAFRATLEEIRRADVILQVHDAASSEWRAQSADVLEVLNSLGIDPMEREIIEVFNKTDILGDDQLIDVAAAANMARGVAVSALIGTGVSDLLEAIDKRISRELVTVDLWLDAGDGRTMAWLHERGRVRDCVYEGARAHVSVDLHPRDQARLRGLMASGESQDTLE